MFANFYNFIKNIIINEKKNEEDENEDFHNKTDCIPEWTNLEKINIDACQALSYVSSYIVKKIHIPDDCSQCRFDLLATEQLLYHLFTTFKEYSPTTD